MTKHFLLFAALLCIGSVGVSRAQELVEQGNDRYDDGALEKARNQYWNSIRTAGDEKDLAVIERKAFEAMQQLQNRTRFKTLNSAAWVSIGSSADGHSSGRIRAMAIDPANPNFVYIAAASGGIWKTTDISARPVNWINLSDRLPTTNFGSIAIDPTNHDIVYAGTGESQGDGYQDLYGAGLYKSTDGGNNWTKVVDVTKGYYCSQILVDATNPQRVYVATGSSGANALLKTEDGGATWKSVSIPVVALSISYAAIAPNRLYLSGFGSIYRSSDYGDTWTKCTTGLTAPSKTSFGRISVAVAPSDPSIVYASIGNGSTRQTLGIWMSQDSGVSWTMMSQFDPTVSGSPNPLGNQQEWCNAIAVRPTVPTQIFVGGLDVYKVGNSGKSYQKISDWVAAPTSSSYVHADIHNLVFADNSTLWACTDGGLAKTTNLSSWQTDMNLGISTFQFVGADADKNLTYTLGGCQDNGTLRAPIGAAEYHLTRSGDGGRTWISPDDGSIAYTTYVYSSFYKSLDSGKTFGATNLVQANAGLYRDDVGNQPGNGEGAPFYPAYDVSSDGSVIAYGGNSHIWVSMNGGADAFNDHHSDKSITQTYTIHLSKQDPTYMFAGSGIAVYRSTDFGATWQSKIVGAGGELVTGITSDPHDHNRVWAVTQGTSASFKHFYASVDGGATWTTPSTQLVGIPCWSVAYDAPTNRIFVGSDNGVLYSEDGGVTWYPLTNGMPYTRASSLKIKGNYLLASTYGRGLYYLDMSQINGVTSATAASGLSIDAISPNPMSASTATIRFTTPSEGYAELRMFDMLGREVKVLDKNYYPAGSHVLSFSREGLASGTYVVMLVSSGRTISSKLVID
ncbi:MAG: T9SS type A sorting domain-containing protein [Bacteroidetes bacterium]|nr:T9SS type A sorting domain-containing protein [Bacteroidota bacterium]